MFSIKSAFRHSTPTQRRTTTAAALVLSCAVAIASLPVLAAEPPAVTDIEMSVAVGTSLTKVTDLMDAGKLNDAAAALQPLRASLVQGNLNEYEKFRVLQTAARLNTALQQYEDAIVDYEALLQLGPPTLSEAERIATSEMTGQLYLQLGNWDKGLQYLLVVNDNQKGNNMETLFRIAFAYSQAGKVAEGIPYMEQALAVGGERAGEIYYSNMVVMYTGMKQYAKAIATMETLIQKFPDSANMANYQQDLSALKGLLK